MLGSAGEIIEECRGSSVGMLDNRKFHNISIATALYGIPYKKIFMLHHKESSPMK
jgi:hypothetical protein